MKRIHFIIAAFAGFPAAAIAKARSGWSARTRAFFKVNAGDARYGEHYKMKGVTSNTLDIKISGQDTDGELAVFEQNGTTAKGGPPLHIHLYQDEWFYVVEGEYLFQIGEEKKQMKAGDTIFLPRNIPHAFIQLTEKAKVIVSFVPAGKMEAFFKATSEWTAPPAKEEVARVFALHEMKVVGAPLNAD